MVIGQKFQGDWQPKAPIIYHAWETRSVSACVKPMRGRGCCFTEEGLADERQHVQQCGYVCFQAETLRKTMIWATRTQRSRAIHKTMRNISFLSRFCHCMIRKLDITGLPSPHGLLHGKYALIILFCGLFWAEKWRTCLGWTWLKHAGPAKGKNCLFFA